MPNLKLDTTELRNRSKSLRATAACWTMRRSTPLDIASVVGHDKLAGKVREFGNNWDTTRGRFREHLEALAKTFEAIAETFEDLGQRPRERAEEKEIMSTLPGEPTALKTRLRG